MKLLLVKMSKTRKSVFLIFLVLTLLWAGAIYSFSASNAEESTVESGRITKIVVRIVCPDYDNLPKAEQNVIYHKCEVFVRKTAHFCAFALLAFLSYFCVGSIKYLPDGLFMQAAVSVPFCVAFAISDEIHQKFVEGRACRLLDVGIDSLGIVCGTLFAILLSLLYKRCIKNK